jgi:hypothetical protein
MEWLSSLVGWSHTAFWLVSVGVPLGLEIGKIQGDQFQNGMLKIFGVDDSDVSLFCFVFSCGVIHGVVCFLITTYFS